MMLKRVAAKIHSLILQRKWNMSPQGASLLGGDYRQDYKKHGKEFMKVYSIHREGFSWDDWHVNELTKENCSEYLRTAQYYAMHPLNGQYSHWIDDKLTLKYLCAGTALDKYMPKYYYQINDCGNILALSDAPNEQKGQCTAENIIECLKTTGELAVKRISGSLGEGFYKASYKDGKYYLNDKAYSQDELIKKFAELKDYLITEYLHPHKEMIPFSADTVNTLRYLIGRTETGEMKLIKSYIRFGTKVSGFVENYAAGGVLCFVSETGQFDYGNILDMQKMKNIIIKTHPDTNIKLKGPIPLWNEIQKAADEFGKYFPQMNYMGLDFVVTSKNEVKILEINSLTSLDAIQLQGSILKTPQGEFFKQHLKTI